MGNEGKEIFYFIELFEINLLGFFILSTHFPLLFLRENVFCIQTFSTVSALCTADTEKVGLKKKLSFDKEAEDSAAESESKSAQRVAIAQRKRQLAMERVNNEKNYWKLPKNH